MPAYEIRSISDIASCLDSQTIDSDTTTVGETIDTKDYGSLDFCFNCEVTAGSFVAYVYEGDESNMSDEAVVSGTGSMVVGSASIASGATGTQTMQIAYNGNKRYARTKVVSDDSANAICSGIAFQSIAKHASTL